VRRRDSIPLADEDDTCDLFLQDAGGGFQHAPVSDSGRRCLVSDPALAMM
jgi:hypothetical protein